MSQHRQNYVQLNLTHTYKVFQNSQMSKCIEFHLYPNHSISCFIASIYSIFSFSGFVSSNLRVAYLHHISLAIPKFNTYGLLHDQCEGEPLELWREASVKNSPR